MGDLMERSLPKWPMMKVTGVPVSVEEAREIIRRTDTFFQYGYEGNDHKFTAMVRDRLKIPYCDPAGLRDLSPNERTRLLLDNHRKVDEWNEKWGVVLTEYVWNSWVSCAYVMGPHGWCHPDGKIGFVDNVGKWPSVEAIYFDWCALAEAFLFLDVGVTLFNGESCEEPKHPVVSFRVRDGGVSIVDPDDDNVHEGHAEPTRGNEWDDLDVEDSIPARFKAGVSAECGIPLEWLDHWERYL